MASTSGPDPDAAAAAFQQFATEAWTLLAVGISVISLRTYARIRSVGFKGLRADDYLVWLAGVSTHRPEAIRAVGNVQGHLRMLTKIARYSTLARPDSRTRWASTPTAWQTTAWMSPQGLHWHLLARNST